MPRESRERKIVAAVPVRNEEAYLGNCLRALADQDLSRHFEVLLFLNNCTDNTLQIARQSSQKLPFKLHIHELHFPPDEGSAGVARKLAMDLAAELAGNQGILLTTDADARVPPRWLAANIREIESGADAVAGRSRIDPIDAARIPAQLHEDEERCQLLGTLLDRITWLIDPDHGDPWPRHIEESGASIGVTVEAFRRAGGLPSLALGEDRVFFDHLRRVDARIRHALDIEVTVSGRVDGRAKGGMADTMRRRIEHADEWLDDRWERPDACARRARLRAATRVAWLNNHSQDRDCLRAKMGALAVSLGLLPSTVQEQLRFTTFGATWNRIQQLSPILVRRQILAANLEIEIQHAASIMAELQKLPRTEATEHQFETDLRVVA
jgi:glycosyltransferase involved in cell wall biosynthesis